MKWLKIATVIKLISNPPNPFTKALVEWLDCPPIANLQVYHEKAKSIVTSNKSPDIPFSFSINPYRGCFHGCAYCYARPTHQYLDFGAGSDFERKIIVKINAPELLHNHFMKKSWNGDPIVFSGITDCYQPLEGSYELTRQCLEICCKFKNPVSIITKGALVKRDIDIISEINEVTTVSVFMSIAFADDYMSKLIEPFAPRPSVRFRAMKALSEAGINVGVGIAPVIPGLNDSQIPEILHMAAENGAQNAFMTLLRLPAEVKDVFLESINRNFPARATKITNQIKEMRGGKLNISTFGNRMSGIGPLWEAVEFLFKSNCKKLGLNKRADSRSLFKNTFERPGKQLRLI